MRSFEVQHHAKRVTALFRELAVRGNEWFECLDERMRSTPIDDEKLMERSALRTVSVVETGWPKRPSRVSTIEDFTPEWC